MKLLSKQNITGGWVEVLPQTHSIKATARPATRRWAYHIELDLRAGQLKPVIYYRLLFIDSHHLFLATVDLLYRRNIGGD